MKASSNRAPATAIPAIAATESAVAGAAGDPEEAGIDVGVARVATGAPGTPGPETTATLFGGRFDEPAAAATKDARLVQAVRFPVEVAFPDCRGAKKR